MKIQVQKTETIEVELTLPCYRKSNCHFFKIIDEDTVIKVTDNVAGRYEIVHSYVQIALQKDHVESNEQEFNEAFERALKALS